MIAYHQTAKIRGALRQVARYMPEKMECLELAVHATEKGVRGGKLYICAKCGLCFKLRDIQVDHIDPVIPVDREVKDWNEYIDRLFCEAYKLQVLCKDCHLIKSNEENSQR